jgi:hypothetical protein
MKAVVFHAVGDIRLDDVPEPKIQEPTDAIVRLTASAICGTDLHFVRGTFSGMKPRRTLGLEAGHPLANRALADPRRRRGSLRRDSAKNRLNQTLSTAWRQTGILMDVHPVPLLGL